MDLEALRHRRPEEYVRALREAYADGLAPRIDMVTNNGAWTQVAVDDAFKAGLDIDEAVELYQYCLPPYVIASAYANGTKPDLQRDVFSHPRSQDQRAFLAVSYGATMTFEQIVAIKSLDVLIAAYRNGTLAPSEDHVDFMVDPRGDCRLDAAGGGVDWYDPVVETGPRALVGEAFVAAYRAGLPAKAEHLERVKLMHMWAWHNSFATPTLAREHVRARILEAAYRHGGLSPSQEHVSGKATEAVCKEAARHETKLELIRLALTRAANADVAATIVDKVRDPRPPVFPRTVLDVRLFTPDGLRELGFSDSAWTRDSNGVEDVLDRRRMCEMSGADLSVAFDDGAIDRAFRENVVPPSLRSFSLDRCRDVSNTIHIRATVKRAVARLGELCPDVVDAVHAEATEECMHLCTFVRACVLRANDIPWRMATTVAHHLIRLSPWLDEYRRMFEVSRHIGMRDLPRTWREIVVFANAMLSTQEMTRRRLSPMDECHSVADYERAKVLSTRCAEIVERYDGTKVLDAASHVFKRSWRHVPIQALSSRVSMAERIVAIAPGMSERDLAEWCGHSAAVEYAATARAIGSRVGASADAILASFKFAPKRLAVMDRHLADGPVRLEDLDPRSLPTDVRHGVTACLRAAHPDKDVNMIDRYVLAPKDPRAEARGHRTPWDVPPIVPDSEEDTKFLASVPMTSRGPRSLRCGRYAENVRDYLYLREHLPGIRPGVVADVVLFGQRRAIVEELKDVPDIDAVREDLVANLLAGSYKGRIDSLTKVRDWRRRNRNAVEDVIELKRLLATADPVRALGSCPRVTQVNGLACYLAAKGSRLVSSTYNIVDGRFMDADFKAS